MRNSVILLAILFAPISGAGAKPLTYQLPEETATLRPAPDMEAAQNNCTACHSVDYIETQPPKRGRAFWEGEVNKMIHSYHAPISDADAKAIVDYLARVY
jgi:sulfite dehydrogenase (cytochrome) subunit B